MGDLFEDLDPPAPSAHEPEGAGPRPLADRLRPARIEDVIGQQHLLAPDGPLGAMLAERRLASLILWGPPGVGKTTIARLLAEASDLAWVQVSAIFTGVAELRKIFETARHRHAGGRGTLLFVDEIHRFNKAQQDGFLPHMEAGRITLVGATTENPSFELNGALLSRARVLRLEPLSEDDLTELLSRAEALMGPLPLDTAARAEIVSMAAGDGRALLNLAEEAFAMGPAPVTVEALARRLTRRAALYDKSGDGHFNLISALHKSVRGSDPEAALYWLARMIEGGEDPRYLARRLVRMAVEDIGLADPEAQSRCLDAWETFERLGAPEGELALAEAAIYLALAPKSNAAYRAWGEMRKLAAETAGKPPPMHILNAPTAMMKDQGYGAGYAYDHDQDEAFSGQDYFPEGVPRPRAYRPVDRGHEAELSRRIARLDQLRTARRSA